MFEIAFLFKILKRTYKSHHQEFKKQKSSYKINLFNLACIICFKICPNPKKMLVPALNILVTF